MADRVTLLCRFGPVRAQAYQTAVLQGVYFAGAGGRRPAPGAPGQQSRGLLVVPYAAAGGYVSPEAWQELCAEERAGRFTLRPGDAVCPGGALPAEGESPAAFLARVPHWVIAQVSDHPRGRMAHFEAVCGEKGASV